MRWGVATVPKLCKLSQEVVVAEGFWCLNLDLIAAPFFVMSPNQRFKPIDHGPTSINRTNIPSPSDVERN